MDAPLLGSSENNTKVDVGATATGQTPGPYGDEAKSADKKKQNLLKNAWFSLGLWQAPRLRKDWDSMECEDEAHVQSLNAFFDTMFAFSISHLGFEVRSGQSFEALEHWVQRFGILLSLWMSTADFSARFDNDDVPFKIFWSLYGVGALGLMIHVTGDNSSVFALCVGYTYLLLSLHYTRNAICLPRCRHFCTTMAIIQFTCATLFFVAYKYEVWQNTLFWGLCFEYYIACGAAYVVRETIMRTYYPHLPRKQSSRIVDVPLHVEFSISRLTSFTMMVLGQLALATAIHPENGFTSTRGLYASVSVAFVVLVSMKLFLFDVDYFDTDDHALSRSRPIQLAYKLMFPMGVAALALLGTGVALLVENISQYQGHRNETFAQGLACYSLGLFLLVSCLQRKLHHVPYTRLLEESGYSGQAEILYIINGFQFYLQLSLGICLPLLFNSFQLPSMFILVMVASSLSFLVVLNLLDEVTLMSLEYMRPAVKVINNAQA